MISAIDKSKKRMNARIDSHNQSHEVYMKKGYEFNAIGLDIATGKERVDVKITSRFDLIKEAEQKRQSTHYMKDMVWTPEGFQPISQEYLARGVAARAEQKNFKEIDDNFKIAAHSRGFPFYPKELEEKTIVTFYERENSDLTYCSICNPGGGKCAGHRRLAFVERNLHESSRDEKSRIINMIAGWFKR